MTKRDYYDILGIKKGADSKEIKSAYRKLAKKYHPDTNPGNKQAEQLFKEVTEAYNVLSDDERRKLYDRFGHAAFDGSMGDDPEKYEQAQNGFFRNGRNQYDTYEDAEDLFGDMFGSFFGGRGKYDSHFEFNTENSYGNYHSDIEVSFEEAALGCDKILHFEDNAISSVSVHIPAGISDGQSVRLKGKGRMGRNGRAGDLLLKVHIRPSRQFERQGMDVYTHESIPYTTAVLGGEAYFRTIYGTVRCKVPSGSQDGSKIRLKGKGIVSMKDASVHGDQYVVLNIEVPRSITPEERELLERLQKIERNHHYGAA